MSNDIILPENIQNILDQCSNSNFFFNPLLRAIGEVLQCDRVFLYIRNPETELCKVAYCWRQNQNIPDVTEADWKIEPEWLPQEDPLYAAALRCEPSVYIEDVETASPKVVNREFELQTFGHRALIHAHLCQDGQLWGILQPSVFGNKRVWSEFDHAIITQLEKHLTPSVVAHVTQFSKSLDEKAT